MKTITDRMKILSLLNRIGKYKFKLMKKFSINIMISINVIEILQCLYEHIAFRDQKVSFLNFIADSIIHEMSERNFWVSKCNRPKN